MHVSYLRKVVVLAIAFMASTSTNAEAPAYAAKSLFFGEDGEVKAVATGGVSSDAVAQPREKQDDKAVVIATTNKKPVDKVKVVAKKNPKDLPIGAAYFVRLKKPSGGSEDALATRVFSTGDRFQLGLKVNRPSHVYIFNEDPSGRITMLHPRPGRSAAVDAMGTVFLPAQGAFEFQGPPGVEKLLVLMSEDEIFQPDATLQKIEPDLVTRAVFNVQDTVAAPAVNPVVASVPRIGDCSTMLADAGSYASKAIVYSQETASVSSNCHSTMAPAYASKAIVFSDDPNPIAGQQLASYVVKPAMTSTKEPLLLKIQLVHR